MGWLLAGWVDSSRGGVWGRGVGALCEQNVGRSLPVILTQFQNAYHFLSEFGKVGIGNGLGKSYRFGHR